MSLELDEKEWIAGQIETRVSAHTLRQNEYIGVKFDELNGRLNGWNRENGEIKTTVENHIKEEDKRWNINWAILSVFGIAIVGTAGWALTELFKRMIH